MKGGAQAFAITTGIADIHDPLSFIGRTGGGSRRGGGIGGGVVLALVGVVKNMMAK